MRPKRAAVGHPAGGRYVRRFISRTRVIEPKARSRQFGGQPLEHRPKLPGREWRLITAFPAPGQIIQP
jgi:hypothetical protein